MLPKSAGGSTLLPRTEKSGALIPLDSAGASGVADVGGGRFDHVGIVAEQADRGVALRTQESTHAAVAVVVVDDQGAVISSADSASAILHAREA